LHQKSIHEGDDVLKSAQERNENRASTNLGNSAEFFWKALAVTTDCLPKREKTLHKPKRNTLVILLKIIRSL
jgi:hypothetical protein